MGYKYLTWYPYFSNSPTIYESKINSVSYNSLKVDGQVIRDQARMKTVSGFSSDEILNFFPVERLESNMLMASVMVFTFIDKPYASHNNSAIIITTSEGLTVCRSHNLFNPRISIRTHSCIHAI